jgi:extracellular factor (EF) 3-hydroxypalmitic acid methyl ester biosynthesis protein
VGVMAIDDVGQRGDEGIGGFGGVGSDREERPGPGEPADWRDRQLFDGPSRRRSDSSAPLDRLDMSLQAFYLAERTYRASDAASMHRAAAAIHALNGALLECEDAAIDLDLLRTKVAGARHLHRRSELCRRLQDWPRGYPGDWESIDYLLDGVNRTPEEDFGHALEQHALWCAASQQHRNKVQHQAMLFDRLITRRPAAKALSIACGGSRDLASLIHRAQDFRGSVVLNDADGSALDVSLARLAPFGDRCIRVQGSALNVVSQAAHFGPYDLVVAGGLFDYLSDGLAIRLLREVYRRCVAADGLFLFTNIAMGNPYRPWMSYMGSWCLIERSEEALVNLCLRASIPRDAISLTKDSTRLAWLIELRKPTFA